MRVLHVVKTSEGAIWAARQARILVELGIEVHVALPCRSGEAIKFWQEAGVIIHILDCSFPLKSPWHFNSQARAIKTLISEIQPDLIHSHFVTTTLMLRLTLGQNHQIPRLFQVPGPLHMEYDFYRRIEIATAGRLDYWIASSQYTYKLYLQSGIPSSRLFLSYYGTDLDKSPMNSFGEFRRKLNIASECKIVGNINFMYSPKYFLMQTRGIKGHENIIDALAIVCRKRPDVIGVFVGTQWGSGQWYEKKLKRRAAQKAGKRIIFAGRCDQDKTDGVWRDFDVAVHVPLSENCGGVIQPLALEVPTIASRVGGLPEVIVDGLTGWLVPAEDSKTLAGIIIHVLDNYQQANQSAQLGNKLVRVMFDVNRTGKEIASLYQHVINPSQSIPDAFDSHTFLTQLAKDKIAG